MDWHATLNNKARGEKMNLWTFNNGNIKNHGRVKIDGNNYVNGDIPLEDFGDFLLTKDHLSPQNAFDRFLSLLPND